MKKLHLICKRDEEGHSLKGLYRVDAEKHTWASGKWDIKPEEAKQLIGGKLFLHQSKTERSHFGGTVIGVNEVLAEDRARPDRVEFEFTFEPDARGVLWDGADHAMASYGGIIDA